MAIVQHDSCSATGWRRLATLALVGVLVVGGVDRVVSGVGCPRGRARGKARSARAEQHFASVRRDDQSAAVRSAPKFAASPAPRRLQRN